MPSQFAALTLARFWNKHLNPIFLPFPGSSNFTMSSCHSLVSSHRGGETGSYDQSPWVFRNHTHLWVVSTHKSDHSRLLLENPVALEAGSSISASNSTSLPTSLEQFPRLSFNTGALQQTSTIWVLICLSKLCKLLPCRDTILVSVEETWIMTNAPNFTSWRITCWVFGYPASMMARKSKKEFHHSPFSSGWQQNEGPPLSRQVAASVNAMRLVTIRNSVI